MRKPDSFETAYNALHKLGSGPMNEEALSELRKVLRASKSLLVAKAAEIVGNRGLIDLVPDLAGSFDRFLVDGPRTDKQCNAKIAIARALNELETLDDSVFVLGSRYVQMEPAFGEPIDTAAELRVLCANGIARVGRPYARYILTDLLVDRERVVRVAAVKALGYLSSPESELLLRLKLQTNETDIEVISQCFASLLVMAPDRSLEFVSRYLDNPDPVIAESAALNIGESRVEGAFEALRQCWEDDPSPTHHRSLLLPIALVRSDDAFEFLLDVVRTGDNTTSAHAITALDLYVDGDSVRKIHQAALSRKGF